MKITIIYLITMIFGMTHTSYSQDFQIPGPYQWKNRIILLFSSGENEKSQIQLDVFNQNRKEFEERDIIHFYITDEEVKAPDKKSYNRGEQLREQYQVPKDAFSVVLIGKDGTQKLQQDEVLTADELFAVIDAMPMRRREIKNDNKD